MACPPKKRPKIQCRIQRGTARVMTLQASSAAGMKEVWEHIWRGAVTSGWLAGWQLSRNTRLVIAKQSLDKWENCCLTVSHDNLPCVHSQSSLSPHRKKFWASSCPQKPYTYTYICFIVAAAGVHARLYGSEPVYCMRACVAEAGWQSTGATDRGWLAASRVTAPCDVPVIDTEHSAGLLWDPWTWAAAPGSSTGGLKSSVQLMFNSFDLCREVAFREFHTSISSSSKTMNGSTEDS